jgi:hypothetical protein
MEDHHFVDPVDEFRPEVVLHLSHHRHLDHPIIVARHLLDHLATQVGGHDDHRVLEIHGTALAIGHAAVVQHLQQHVEDIRVRLLDLVEQDHAVRLATHGFGQVAALFVADVARRRADQAGDGMLLHELAHVDADQMVLAVEHELGQRLAQLGLADARRAQEQEGAVRPVRIGQPGTRAADGIADQAHSLVLPDHPLVQLVFHLEQLFALALHHLADRNAGGTADHFGNFLGTHLRTQQPVLFLLAITRLFSSLELGFKLRQLAVLQLRHLAQFAFALQTIDVGFQMIDFFLDLGRTQYSRFLGLPDFFQVGVFLGQLGDLFLDQAKALL